MRRTRFCAVIDPVRDVEVRRTISSTHSDTIVSSDLVDDSRGHGAILGHYVNSICDATIGVLVEKISFAFLAA
jgi:hypothetical protein